MTWSSDHFDFIMNPKGSPSCFLCDFLGLGDFFTAKTQRREEPPSFWLRLCCAVFICVHLWLRLGIPGIAPDPV